LWIQQFTEWPLPNGTNGERVDVTSLEHLKSGPCDHSCVVGAVLGGWKIERGSAIAVSAHGSSKSTAVSVVYTIKKITLHMP
jgi:hypothetical protein